jgi:hypothetical protein
MARANPVEVSVYSAAISRRFFAEGSKVNFTPFFMLATGAAIATAAPASIWALRQSAAQQA